MALIRSALMRKMNLRLENSTTALLWLHKSGQGLFCEFTERKYLMSKAFTAKFDERATKAVNEKFGSVMKMFEGPQ